VFEQNFLTFSLSRFWIGSSNGFEQKTAGTGATLVPVFALRPAEKRKIMQTNRLIQIPRKSPTSKQNRFPVGWGAFLFTVVTLALSTQLTKAAATVLELGPVTVPRCTGGTESYGINANGETVGANTVCDASGEYYSFRASNSGSTEALTGPLDTALAGGGSGGPGYVTTNLAWDIKADAGGQTNDIVGWMIYRGTNRAFFYRKAGSTTHATALAVPSGYSISDSSVAYSVSPYGSSSTAVGYVKIGSQTRAAYWYISAYGGSCSSSLNDLGNTYFSGTDSAAHAILYPQIVGYYVSSGNRKAVAINSGTYDLPVHASATDSEALGLAYNGGGSGYYIVGYYTSNGYQRPILWTYSGGSATYTHLAVPAGKTDGVARGVNSAGRIVGSVSAGGTEQACEWSSNGSMAIVLDDLGISGWTFTRAYQVNASGKIVGAGNHSGSRGFVLFGWED
jgi:hypothetical protein